MIKMIKTFIFAIVAMATVSCAIDMTPVADCPETDANLTKITFTATGEACGLDDPQSKAYFLTIQGLHGRKVMKSVYLVQIPEIRDLSLFRQVIRQLSRVVQIFQMKATMLYIHMTLM